MKEERFFYLYFAMFITPTLQLSTSPYPSSRSSLFHSNFQSKLSRTSNVVSSITIPIRTLNTSSQFLLAQITILKIITTQIISTIPLTSFQGRKERYLRVSNEILEYFLLHRSVPCRPCLKLQFQGSKSHTTSVPNDQ